MHTFEQIERESQQRHRVIVKILWVASVMLATKWTNQYNQMVG